jgi:xanthosine utilization system XapX-like protein
MALNHRENPERWQSALPAVVAFGIALVIWQLPGLSIAAYPFRLFVTMIHELGHGLAAVLTGGSFLRFEVSPRGAGLAYTSGGSRFIIIQAGYLGTALFGAALLLITNRIKRPDYVAIGLGVFIGVLTLLYSDIGVAGLSLLQTIAVAAVIAAALYLILMREETGRRIGLGVAALGGLLLVVFAGTNHGGNGLLTIVAGVSSGAVLALIGYRADRRIVLIVLNFLAFLVGLQAITDVWVLLQIISVPSSVMPHNDAAAMADTFGGSAKLWAIWWIALDVLIFGTALYWTVKRLTRRGQEPETTRTGQPV